MPRPENPGTITVGSGLAATESIEANAFIAPAGGLEGLRVHIQDPSRAHEARAIHVEDTPGNFVSDHVEGALEELVGFGSSGRNNGMVEGGTFTDAGLNITLATTTTVRINGADHDFSGVVLALLDNTTQYVYVDASTQTLVRTVGVPTLPSEDILIAEVTTLAGVVTGSRDGRFFIFNLDRKPPLTVRSEGTSHDSRSEAAFLTLTAAMLYLELYATGAEPAQTHRILVRGSHVISQTVVLPTDGIIFVGEGEASFWTGAAVAPMFDTNGRGGAVFDRIEFVCNHAASWALGEIAAGTSDLVITNCQFRTGGVAWQDVINYAGAGTTRTGFRIADCTITATNRGIVLGRVNDCHITNTRVTGSGGSTLTGITFGTTFITAEGRSSLQGCIVNGFVAGIVAEGEQIVVRNCSVDGATTGVAITGASENCALLDTTITLDATDGTTGIVNTGSFTKIRGCRINNPRTGGAWTAPLATSGILLNGNPNVSISDTRITGFLNENDGTGNGILLAGTDHDCTITNCFVDESQFGVNATAGGDGLKVTDCTIKRVETGVFASGIDAKVSDCNILTDVDRGVTGMVVAGDRCQVTGTTFIMTRTVWAGEDPAGIDLQSSADFTTIDDCTILGFRNGAVGGASVRLSDQTNNVTVSNTRMDGSWFGVHAPSVNHHHLIVSGCHLEALDSPLWLDSNDPTHSVKIIGNTFEPCTNSMIRIDGYSDFEIIGNTLNGGGTTVIGMNILGTNGTNLRTRRFTIADNNIRGMTGHGLRLDGYVQNGTITGNTIDNHIGTGTPITAYGIHISEAGPGDIPKYLTVNDNTVWNCIGGIIIDGGFFASDRRPSVITVDGNTIHHIANNINFSDDFVSYGGKGVGCNKSDNLTISNNTISDIGEWINADDTTFAPATTHVGAHGVYCLNCEGLTIDGNNVTGLTPKGTSTALGIGVQARNDTTPAYVQRLGFSITGNTIRDPNELTDVGILIAADDDTGTGWNRIIADVTIDGNVVHRCDNGIAIRPDTRAVISTFTVTGNSIGQARGDAIQVVAGTDTSSLTICGVDNNVITDPTGSGILFDAALMDFTVASMTIRGNRISSPSVEGIQVITPGGVSVQRNFRNCNISGNTVTDWGQLVVQATAIAKVVAAVSTATLTIGGIPLTDAGGPRTPGSDDYDGFTGGIAAIAISIAAAINDGANSFTGTATAGASGAGVVILTAVPVGAAGNGITLVTSDVLDIEAATPIFTQGKDAGVVGAGIHIDQRGAIHNLVVQGNTARALDIVGGAGPAFLFDMTSTGVDLYNFSVVGNVALGGYASGVDDACPGFVMDFDVIGRSFGFHNNQALFCASGFDLTASGGGMKGLAISGNIMRGNHDSTPTATDVLIDGGTPGAVWTAATALWNGLNMYGNIAEDGPSGTANDWGTAYTSFGSLKADQTTAAGSNNLNLAV